MPATAAQLDAWRGLSRPAAAYRLARSGDPSWVAKFGDDRGDPLWADEGRVAPFKRRRRGVTPGELVVSLAESELIGGDCFDDIEVLRADRAGARLRAVAGVPSAPCARQLAARFARCQIQAAERALARAGQALDRQVGRDRSAPATIDLDATRITVYRPGKQGARRTRTGELAYAPHIATCQAAALPDPRLDFPCGAGDSVRWDARLQPARCTLGDSAAR